MRRIGVLAFVVALAGCSPPIVDAPVGAATPPPPAPAARTIHREEGVMAFACTSAVAIHWSEGVGRGGELVATSLQDGADRPLARSNGAVAAIATAPGGAYFVELNMRVADVRTTGLALPARLVRAHDATFQEIASGFETTYDGVLLARNDEAVVWTTRENGIGVVASRIPANLLPSNPTLAYAAGSVCFAGVEAEVHCFDERTGTPSVDRLPSAYRYARVQGCGAAIAALPSTGGDVVLLAR